MENIVKTVQQVNTMDELTNIINKELNSHHESEGFVLVDSNGFMTKFKGLIIILGSTGEIGFLNHINKMVRFLMKTVKTKMIENLQIS